MTARIVAYLAGLALAAIGSAIDSWAQSRIGVGGFVGVLAGIWATLRLHPNGINGPAAAPRSSTPAFGGLAVDAPPAETTSERAAREGGWREDSKG